MKSKIPCLLFGLFSAASASAQGLYYIDTETQESLPLKWVVGTDVVYDDNVNPGYSGDKDSSFAINPYVGMSMVSMTPQTTWDVYARLGLIYYLDAPEGMDDVSSQSRAGVSVTHRVSERLRFVSRNFISYELEPDYSHGVATSRATGEYFYWQTDNSVGFRWTERFGTYTGIRLTGLDYASDVSYNDRLTWELYNQCRYQLSPQTVLTFDTRYSQTSGDDASSDYQDIHLLLGAEHRFTPNTVGVVRAGAQLHDVEDGEDNSSPYIEFALNSRINEQFSIRSYARYGIEGYNTVQSVGGNLYEYDDRQTLRFGVSADYALSQKVTLTSGVDYIPSDYGSGRSLTGGSDGPDLSEDIINAYIGVSVKFTDMITGSLSYNYTNSNSDITQNDYDRNRISLGLSAEF